MCDVLPGGVSGYVKKCDRGRGSKLAKNSVTYSMDGPLSTFFCMWFTAPHPYRCPHLTLYTVLWSNSVIAGAVIAGNIQNII